MLKAGHAVAACIKPAGDVHHYCSRIIGKIFTYEFIQHYSPCYNAAVHGRVFISKGEIIVKLADYLLCLFIVNRAAAFAFLCAGVYGLQHCFRHTGNGYLLVHTSYSLKLIKQP